jgi:hypothetical protein
MKYRFDQARQQTKQKEKHAVPTKPAFVVFHSPPVQVFDAFEPPFYQCDMLSLNI